MDRDRPRFPSFPRPLLSGGLAALLALSGCDAGVRPGSPGEASLEPPRPAALVFGVQVLDTTSGPCNGVLPGCARVRLTYPEIIGGPEPVASRARDWVRERTLDYALEEPGEVPTTPREWIRDFLEEHRRFLAESPGAFGGWWVERDIHVVRNDARVVALVLRESSYLGGAHPNSAVQIVNLDARTGEVLTPAGLVRPGTEEELRAAVEDRVRLLMDLPAGIPLSQGGFFEDVLALPMNALLAEEGLVLEYNPYEVAPYAVGSIRILVPWGDVAHLLREPDRWVPDGG